MLIFLAAATAPSPLEHVLPHVLFWHVTNQMFMATIAAVLMLLIFPMLFSKADASAPTGARNVFEAILEFLRLEVFRPALKENTDRFLPFLWTMFFFILFCNLLGFIPIGEFISLLSGGKLLHFGGTATGTLTTTSTLAVITFFAVHVSGLQQIYRALRDGRYGHHARHTEHGSEGHPPHEAAYDLEHMRGEALSADLPGDVRAIGHPTQHYADDQPLGGLHHGHVPAPPAHDPSAGKSALAALLLAFPLYIWNFAPHPFKPQPGESAKAWFGDIPLWLLLLVLELIGAVIKPFALSIRLFANMIGGHIVLAVLVGLIVSMPTIASQLGVGVPVTLLSLLIRLLELFVAFLQTYIFVFLATLFIASAVAPEH